MTADRLVSVTGLGFGDCGKGACTDWLVRRHRAHTVVRFNGGAQAGHNVVIPDGRHHTYSQLGSGTFCPGVFTVLAHPVVVHPTALGEEARVLAAASVGDALERLLIDPRCRITTPFHQAAGRLRELFRGSRAHGSCGAGFGETVRHAIASPEQALHWHDLADPGRARAKLELMRAGLRDSLAGDAQGAGDGGPPTAFSTSQIRDEWRIFDDDGIAERWLAQAREVMSKVPETSVEAVHARLCRPGTLIYEGAQGVLLGERHGFHPHTTWSDVSSSAAEAVAAEAGLPREVMHLGVLRSYLTRHGAGPLPTEDARLDALAEPHNGAVGWQGRFRRGHADEVLLRYALAVAGPLHGVVLTHLDALGGAPRIEWCTGYEAPAGRDDASLCVRDGTHGGLVGALRPGLREDLGHNARLTELLAHARPRYDTSPPVAADDFIARIEVAASLPVVLGFNGPTHLQARACGPLG